MTMGGVVFGVAGETVWARVGTSGWRPAVIAHPGTHIKTGMTPPIFVDFADLPRGRRKIGDLVPWDPRLNGADQPEPYLAAMITQKERIS